MQKVIKLSTEDSEERVNTLLAEGYQMVGVMADLLLLEKLDKPERPVVSFNDWTKGNS
jgi:hypothetical protein